MSSSMLRSWMHGTETGRGRIQWRFSKAVLSLLSFWRTHVIYLAVPSRIFQPDLCTTITPFTLCFASCQSSEASSLPSEYLDASDSEGHVWLPQARHWMSRAPHRAAGAPRSGSIRSHSHVVCLWLFGLYLVLIVALGSYRSYGDDWGRKYRKLRKQSGIHNAPCNNDASRHGCSTETLAIDLF